ncbi:DUF721 domain-containing protein [Palleronia sediminis]|uniref:DUF721 domain-containing protein n=1 Tax=Palleronia sediminis TaxID=2547833 RepID=A0A4V3B980_9RHOB|nr:DUF721 domain-containing protein [Palleronia sediminis]TDL78219.1 DUF721 domain-containing protein [Palleronia sediminis]
MTSRTPKTRTFRKRAVRAADLVSVTVRRVGEGRGFAVSRVLTHWDEIAGPALAAIARPVEVKYGHRGKGGTLRLLTSGAQAPMVQMQLEPLRDRINAAYGYNAIARILVTQTAPIGFGEDGAGFDITGRPPPAREPRPPDEAQIRAARDLVGDVSDPAFRDALERLACTVLTKSRTEK